MLTDRSIEAKGIESKSVIFWTDDDIAKLSKAYAYSSGVAALEGLWARTLMAQRYAAQREEELRLTIQSLIDRIAKLEKK